MRKNIVSVVSILLISLLAIRCSTVTELNPVPQNPVEGKIILTAAEGFTRHDIPTEPVLKLSMRTAKIYGCINYRITYEFVDQGSRLLFNILGVEIGDVCLTALGPATAFQTLAISNGQYIIRIAVGGRHDDCVLIVTDTTIILVPSDTSVSNVAEQLHWRIPRKSLAYYSGTYTGDEWLSAAFDDTLRRHLSLTEIKVPATGVWPYSLTSMGYYYNAPAKFYRYSAEADYDSAGALLKTFSKTVLKGKQGTGFSLVNWRNKYYNSWMLVNQ